MKKHAGLSMKERRAAVNAVAVLGVNGIFTIDDHEEWAVRPERIAEVLRTHSSCIPSAMSGWSETVPTPTTWAIWWISRLAQAKHSSECGMGGSG